MCETTTAPPDYTDEEIRACIEVRKRLIEEKKLSLSEISDVELTVITLSSKCRVEEAVNKFMTYHNNLLKEFNVTDLWNFEGLENQWHRLLPAGTDEEGRQIMWINGGKTQVEDESKCVKACCLYFFAVHSDLHTLRNGVSLVIDTSTASSEKIGNEKKLQIAWQNFPTRAQHIFILGTTTVTRVAVNAIIAVASLFAKNKIIARIRFKKHNDLRKMWGDENMPEKHGGLKRLGSEEWVRKRLDEFPRMTVPNYFDQKKTQSK